MAIKFLPRVANYIGLSTDDKSAISQHGNIIYYTDTKIYEICDNLGNWGAYNTSIPAGTNNIGKVTLASSDVAIPVDLQYNQLTDAEALPVKISGRLLQVAQIGTDQAATFANSALVNTQVNVDFTSPIIPAQQHHVVVYNPSTVTDLTVKIFNVSPTLAGSTRYTLLTTLSIPKSQAITGTTVESYANIIEGLFPGTNVRMVISNDTALGAADGFSAYIRLKSV